MSAAANNFPPKWVLMEPFVSTRDYDEGFADESRFPIRTSGTTSWDSPFSVAFKLAEPPAISRLYAYLRGFAPQRLSIGSTHQHLALFCLGKSGRCGQLPVQDLFVFNASDLSLNRLPHCLCNLDDGARCDGRVPRSTPTFPPAQRPMSVSTTGLLCRGKEFVVAEAELLVRGPNGKVYAEIYWLRSSSADYSGCSWRCTRKRIPHCDSTGILCCESYTVTPLHKWLCWIHYRHGVLFGDMFAPTPTFTWVRLPPEEEFGSTHAHPPNSPPCWMYRCVSAIESGSCLKFIKVDRHDGVPHGPLKDGAGFTITCHTLLLKDDVLKNKLLKDKVWEKDYSVTSNELWSANPDLSRDILIFPQVNIDKPHVAHFLIIEKSMCPWKKMWVVTIDMNTKKVESCNLYINGWEARGTEDADLTKEKSFHTMPFVPCGFSEFLHRPRANSGELGKRRYGHQNFAWVESVAKRGGQGRTDAENSTSGRKSESASKTHLASTASLSRTAQARDDDQTGRRDAVLIDDELGLFEIDPD